MKRLILTLAVCLSLSAQCFGQALEFGALGGAYIGPMQAQLGNIATNAPKTLTFTGVDTGWCARVMATNTKDFKSVAVNFSAVTTPGTVTLRIETVDANGKPSGSLYDAAATKQFTPAAGWNVVTFDSLPTTGTTAGTMYAVVMLKDDVGTTCTLLSSTNSNSYGNWPTAVLTATAGNGDDRSLFAEVANVSPIGYFVMDDDTLTSMGCTPVAAAGAVFALQSANHAVAQKIVLEKDIVIRGVRFAANTGFSRYGTPTVDLRMRILDSSNVAVSGTTVTIDKDTLTATNGRGLTIPLPPTTLAAGTYRVCFDSAGDGSHGFGVYYITIPDAALQSAGFCYSQSTDMGTTFTWTDTPTRVLPFGLELDSIPADSGGGDAVDQITIVPFYGSDIAEDSGDYPFEFNVYQNGVPFALSSGAVQASLAGGTDAATGLTLSTIATGRYKVVIDSDSSAFNGGGNLNLTLSAGTVDGNSVVNAKVGEVSVGRNATAPDGFAGLDIDGSGAVIIQDGTDPGQIDTNAGAVVSVTTAGTVTNGVNVTHILGTTLTDVGSGDFGSTLAGNFSILFGQSTNESNTAVGASEINNILIDTAEIGTDGAGLTNINLPNQTMDIVGSFTGNLSGTVGGIAGTITTLDALDTAQDTQHGTTQTAIADVPNVTEFNAGLAALPQTGDLATPAEINTEIEAGQVGIDTAAIVAKLPTAGAKMAGEGATAKNLDEIEAGGSTQPRINRKPDPGFTIQVSRRADGTYKCTKPIRLTAGAISEVYAFIDMAPLFGSENFVETVGTPVVSGGSVTASATGPRDTYAIVELDGTATAGEERTVTVPVTMTSGTQLNVVFDLEVFE